MSRGGREVRVTNSLVLGSYLDIFAKTVLFAFWTTFCWRSFSLRLRQCTLLLPSARCTLECGLFVGINWPLSVDGRIPFFLCNAIIATPRRSERGDRCSRRGRCRTTLRRVRSRTRVSAGDDKAAVSPGYPLIALL